MDREEGKESRRVFVAGAFDLLHAGHIQLFRFASMLGHVYVSVGSDEAIAAYKRTPIILQRERLEMVRAVRYVYAAELSRLSGRQAGFDLFEIWKPHMWIVDRDDPILEEKLRLMETIGCQPVYNEERLGMSTTGYLIRAQAPTRVPMRVDFAGGWLDVPALARPDGCVVNCAIIPGLNEYEWQHGGGMGGSAAAAVRMGLDVVERELNRAGWQDAAIITETGCCVWDSGPAPRLRFKTSGDFLQGRMAVVWTGGKHSTADLVTVKRDYDEIAVASKVAGNAVMTRSVPMLMDAVNRTHQVQIREGMEPLPELAGAARKYVGAGWGGYALYLFARPADRDDFVREREGAVAIEPYCVNRAMVEFRLG